MSEYIVFVLLGKDGMERKVRMNANDPNEVYLWMNKWIDQPRKKPNWLRYDIDTSSGYHVNTSSGFQEIVVARKKYLLHRVCYYAHNPGWDIYDTSHDNSIDHKDQNPANNRISNLRLATHSQRTRTDGGVKGFCWCPWQKNSHV